MLGKPHLKMLQALDSTSTPTQLSENVGHSVKHVSETLNDLENLGLVTSKREGRERVYRLTDTRAVMRYRRLASENPNVDFANLLTRSHLHVVYHLDRERTPGELELLAKPSRTTIYRVLKQLRNRGIVANTEGSRYVVRQPFEALAEFAREVASMKHTAMNREQFPDGRNHVVWNNSYEHIALVREISGTAIKDVNEDWLPEISETDGRYYLTGLEVLEPYDLRFLTTTGHHVFYTEELHDENSGEHNHPSQSEPVPPIEDVLCHLVIIQSRTTNQRYTLLAIARFEDGVDRRLLLDRATHYDVEEKMEDMLDYLNQRGEVEGEADLPSWSEFQRIAAEYEVEV